jgi:hypothetical protein
MLDSKAHFLMDLRILFYSLVKLDEASDLGVVILPATENSFVGWLASSSLLGTAA